MSRRATVRFYAELNDFLPPQRRYTDVERPLGTGVTVKDLIESLGVPHPEVEVIMVNGESVGFEHRVEDGDRISVFPTFESLDATPLVRLRPEPLRTTRFALDANLGQLARLLRLCGFDTLFSSDFGDDELVRIAKRDGRIILTRDVGVLKRRSLTHGYFVRATEPRRQLIEVVTRLDLGRSIEPFTRCMNCNGKLIEVDKDDVVAEIEPETRRFYEEFFRCGDCGRVYWRGSHYDKLVAIVEEARGSSIRSSDEE